jgi:hypothetical protein
MEAKIKLLAGVLKIANEQAINASTGDDNGTCNLDAVVIKLPRWTANDLKELKELSGIRISDTLSGMWNGYRFIGFTTYGQADEKTRMLEAAHKVMKEGGYDVYMYYQID